MFFSHLDGVEGRLQFVQINSECGTVVDDPRLLVSFLQVPEERSVDADMGYLLSLIPNWVAGAAGQDTGGQQWIILMQQSPDVWIRTSARIRNRALKTARMGKVREELVVDEHDVAQYYLDAIDDERHIVPAPDAARTASLRKHLHDLTFDIRVKGFVLELTNTTVVQFVDAWRAVADDLCMSDPDPNDVVAAVMDHWINSAGSENR